MRTHLDLFSGIGGFALAANWAGFTTVGFVEYEDYPRRVLGKQFPGIPIHSDIHDFDATPFRGVDLVTGGFPCQPFSAAGKQRGKEDDRWLWKEMLRVIVEAQPTWVLAENVAGLINMALDEVLADLEAQDYATGTCILPACSQNALHRRDRVWIIAKHISDVGNPQHDGRDESTDRRSTGKEFISRGSCQPKSKTQVTVRESAGAGDSSSDVAHSEGNGLQGGRAKDKRSEYSEEVGQRNQESLRNSAGSTEGDVAHSDGTRLQGFTESNISGGEGQWQTAGNGLPTNTKPGKFIGRLGGAVDGIPEGLDFPRRWGDGSWEDGIPRVTTQKKGRTQRLKGLGNAIVPQVAYEIIRHFD